MTLDMSALPIYEHLPNIIYYGKAPSEIAKLISHAR